MGAVIQDNPLYSIMTICAGAWLFKMWLSDMRADPKPKGAFPGAFPAAPRALAIAVAGALALLAFHTFSEISAGLDSKQSSVTPWALPVWISAAFVEELIFRGYLVLENRGRAALVAGIVACSAAFALMHPYLWDYAPEVGFSLSFTASGIMGTVSVFELSLWLYAVRFLPFNPSRSLLPCVAAHAAYNCGVFAVKYAQGFVAF